jgi:hypothetical protein
MEMKMKQLMRLSDANDRTVMQVAARVAAEMELRGLPDLSFKQGYKVGFLAALQDEQFGPGQVWDDDEIKELHQELDRRFAA